MARDIFLRLDRCQYCGRPGFIVWDADLFTCGREVCESLAFAEVRRRHHGPERAPEDRLSRALLASFDTFAHALRRDVEGEVLSAKEAAVIHEQERAGTARILSEVRALARRYPPPARPPTLPRRRTARGGSASAPPVRRRVALRAPGTESS
jgi:hypothetical protein